MSAKKAKQLRKLTQAIIQMQVSSGNKISDETLYIENQKNRKFSTIPGKLGAADQSVQIAAGTILTTVGSVRGVYRAIKKRTAKGETMQKPYASKLKALTSVPGVPSKQAVLISD